ncbi:MAG: hypothetical protein II551_03075 [Paludibacteraceae bacterium]|nr:hypothetical protein [Paludibacteraceae bacterium]
MRTQEYNNIKWEEIPTGEDIKSSISEPQYKNLYQEMKVKCAPENFMTPYDAQKVAIANQIYKTLVDKERDFNVNDEQTPQELRDLRVSASSSLGLNFSPTRLFTHISNLINPKQYTSSQGYYDSERLSEANEAMGRLIQIKDNYEALEKFIDTDPYYKKITQIPEEPEEPEEKGLNLNPYEIVGVIITLGIPIIIYAIIYAISHNL